MKCLKCGRDLDREETFCPLCQAVMAVYPVKPDTIVLLPKRTAAAPKRERRRRLLNPEEELPRLRKRVLTLGLLNILLTLALLGILITGLFHLRHAHTTHDGKNYTVVNTTPTEADVSRETSTAP